MASGGRPKPQILFLPVAVGSNGLVQGVLGDSLSGRGFQPSNWEADALPLIYCRPRRFVSSGKKD